MPFKSCFSHKCRFVCAVFFCALFASCAGIPVLPGERAQIYTNISAEYYAIAEAYYGLEKYEKAIEYYLLAGRDKKSRYQIDYKLARSYAMVKKWEQSEALYVSLLTTDPENTNLSLSLAYVFAQGGKYEQSRELYDKLLLRDEFDISVVQNSILLRLQNDDFVGAENSLGLYEQRFAEDQELETYRKKITTAKEAYEKKQAEKTAENEKGTTESAPHEIIMPADNTEPAGKNSLPAPQEKITPPKT